MKIRTGFVSNSSSSSFMVGIGVITDRDKANKWIASLEKEKWEYEFNIIDIEEEREKRYSSISIREKMIEFEAPTNDYQSVTLNLEAYYNIADKNTDIITFCIGNDEGDSAFMSDPEDWACDLDYDIDLDWFSDNQQKVFNGFCEENGISLTDVTYGAGRNG